MYIKITLLKKLIKMGNLNSWRPLFIKTGTPDVLVYKK